MLELSLAILLNLMFMAWNSSHPLFLALLLILTATLMGGLAGLILSKWLLYVIILLFLGGMMIIFTYMTTLASNEKLLLQNNFILIFLPFIFITLIFFWNPYSLMKKEMMVSHLYYTPFSSMLWFLAIYLLLALFIVVKLTQNFKGALTKFS